MPLTAKQLELRRQGIGSTDISAICGLNAYKSAMEVCLDKIGKPIECDQTDAQYWGHALEPLLAERCEQELDGLWVIRWGNTVRHGEHQWMLGTPDAGVFGDQEGPPPHLMPHMALYGLEHRTAFSYQQVPRWRWGGDPVPEEYLVRCAWCMAVTDLDRWDVAVLFAGCHGAEYRQYALNGDRGLEQRLVEIGQAFWTDHVLPHRPPHPDGSASALQALRQKSSSGVTAGLGFHPFEQ